MKIEHAGRFLLFLITPPKSFFEVVAVSAREQAIVLQSAHDDTSSNAQVVSEPADGGTAQGSSPFEASIVIRRDEPIPSKRVRFRFFVIHQLVVTVDEEIPLPMEKNVGRFMKKCEPKMII